jgi:hypothetical protein
VADGVIQFLPASQKEGVAGGAVVKDGKYDIERAKGLVPGEYRVTISSASGGNGGPAGEAPGVVKKEDIAKDSIPEKYNAKSTLTATIKAGATNTFDFPLKSK